MLAAGTVFSSVGILAIAGFLLLCLSVDGIVFHRSIGLAKRCLTIETTPQKINCTVGKQVEVENTMSNRSSRNFRITEFTVILQAQLNEQKAGSFLLAKHGKRTIRTQFQCRVPGRFEIQAVKVTLTSRANVFKHSVLTPDQAIVIARPTINPSRLAFIDSTFLGDLTSDRIVRGAGTDLAGIKPSTNLEDLRRVDWKSTARTGKLMVKEFYLEKQPTVMLVIDSSQTMNATGKGESILGKLLATLPNLLTSFSPVTPIGLTVYDEKSVITNIPAEAGEHQRELVLDTLVSHARSRPTSRSNFHAVRGDTATTSIERYQYRKRFNSVLVRLYSFSRDARLRHRMSLHEQGAFMALARMGGLSDLCLIIAVTDGKTSLNGLIEGARTATSSGHRVILVLLLDYYQKIPTSYIFSELQNIGIRMQECFPEELPGVIQAEIARMSRERIVSHNH